MIKNRDFQHKRSTQDRYMKVVKDREIVEDLDADENDGVLAKKRKIKRAA